MKEKVATVVLALLAVALPAYLITTGFTHTEFIPFFEALAGGK